MSTVTCREFDEVVHGFVRMEILDVTLREAVLDHAGRCEKCAERMAEATALAEACESVRESLQEQHLPPRVEAAVLAAFRNHHRRASARRSFEWAAVGAIAAVALIFLWTVGTPSRGGSPRAPRKDISSRSSGPVDARLVGLPQPAEIIPVAETDEVNAATGETLADAGFERLPFADEIGPEDLGMVVRVLLTKASLTELGYPVTDTSEEDLVSADVLVGEDGWPRAVKLVQ